MDKVVEEDTFLVDKLDHKPPEWCSRKLGAYLAAFSSVTMAGACMATSQLLGGSVPSFQLVTWRFLVQTLMCGAYAASRGTNLALSKHQILPVLGCIILQATSSLARFTATVSVSIGTVEGLIFSLTIGINVALTACKKSKAPWYLYTCGVLSCIGIILLTQPDFLFGAYHRAYHGANGTYDVHVQPWTAPCAPNSALLRQHTMDKKQTGHNLTEWNTPPANQDASQSPRDLKHQYWLGIFLSLLTGFVMALRYELVHFIDDVNNASLCFWIGIGGMAICIVGVPFERLTLPTQPHCIIFFVLFILLQYNVPEPYCLKYISPAVYALIKAQQLPVLFLLQTCLDGVFKPGIGNWLETLGAILCIIACSFIPLYQIVSDVYCTKQEDDKENAKKEVHKAESEMKHEEVVGSR